MDPKREVKLKAKMKLWGLRHHSDVTVVKVSQWRCSDRGRCSDHQMEMLASAREDRA